MHIAHVIVGLGDGGAERTLFKVATADNENRHEVISLTSLGKYGPMLLEEGVPCQALGAQSWRWILVVFRLVRLLRSTKPDLINAWMPHAALLVSLGQIFVAAPKVFWSIRATDYGRGMRSLPTRVVVQLLAYMSHFLPRKILVVSERAIESHANIGFSREKMVCISNGYSSASVARTNDNGTEVAEASSHGNRLVLGMVARYHYQKDHKGLLAALSIVKANRKDWILKLAGPGVSDSNGELVALISEMGLSNNVFLLGQVAEPETIYRHLDVHILASSFGEGFPNVVAESMLSGVPNIVTDVGDSARIVGDTGWVVSPNSPQDLADVIEDVLSYTSSEIHTRGRLARERVEKEFSLDAMIRAYSKEFHRRHLVVFPRYSELGASSRIRMFQYEEILHEAGWDVSFNPFADDTFLKARYAEKKPYGRLIGSYLRRLVAMRKMKLADLVWVEKELFPWIPAWVENRFISGKMVVYDFDDAVYEQFREHPNALIRFLLKEKVRRTTVISRGVIAGNRTLHDYFQREVGVVTMEIPSAVQMKPLDAYTGSIPGGKRPFIFGWIGTPITFKAYLEPLIPLFSSIADSLNGEFWIMGAGYSPQSFGNITHFPWSESSEKQFLRAIDVGIMPLSEDAWSRGKCGYKLLQYMAFRKAVVASPVGANQEIVSHGETGYLARVVGDWKTYLTLLSSDRQHTRTMGERGMEKVSSHFSTATAGLAIVDFFDRLVGSKAA